MAAAIELLETLEDLADKELKTFKWYLQQADFLKDLLSIPKSQLENADRPDTVDWKPTMTSVQRIDLLHLFSSKLLFFLTSQLSQG
uniref:Pyrin domain-containing protein n=1 Tax=Anabas testudineus TaxID=64144 RepID=A0A7N6BMA8_ANATE